jgi:flagellar biogenesis protein FliO
MRLYDKKYIISLSAAIVLFSMTFAGFAQSSTQEIPKLTSNIVKSADVNFPNTATYSNGNLNTNGLFLRMMSMVMIVAALGVAIIYVQKKLMPKFSNLPAKKIKIVETVHLGRNKTLHLLKIGNRQLLVGSTSENITALSDLTDALAETDPSV